MTRRTSSAAFWQVTRKVFWLLLKASQKFEDVEGATQQQSRWFDPDGSERTRRTSRHLLVDIALNELSVSKQNTLKPCSSLASSAPCVWNRWRSWCHLQTMSTSNSRWILKCIVQMYRSCISQYVYISVFLYPTTPQSNSSGQMRRLVFTRSLNLRHRAWQNPKEHITLCSETSVPHNCRPLSDTSNSLSTACPRTEQRLGEVRSYL